MTTSFSHPPLPDKCAVSTGNVGDESSGSAVLGLVSSTETQVLDLTWRSPLFLQAQSLLEEEDWLPSSDWEFPKPADGSDNGHLSPAGWW